MKASLVKAIICAAVIAGLAGCGGSGDSTATNNTPAAGAKPIAPQNLPANGK